MSNNLKVPQKRRLTDLYAIGKEVTLNDDGEEAEGIKVYIAKINDIEQKTCIQKSASARAKYMVIERQKDHPERPLYEEQLETMVGSFDNLEGVIDLLIAQKLMEEEASIEAKLAADEETWGKNNYVETLRDTWLEEMEARYAEDPEDEDAKRVHDELLRFAHEVDEELEVSRQDLIDSYMGQSPREIIDQGIDRLIDLEGSSAWVTEFQRWRLYFAVRDPDNRKERYFESREELDYLDGKIFKELNDHYESLLVSGVEGKD